MTYFLRTLAGLFFLFATIALMADVTRYMNGQPFQMTSLYTHWLGIAPQSLKSVAGFVQRYAHPYFWDPMLVRVLVLPSWLVLGAIGIALGVVGRRRRRVNIYAN